VHAYWREATYSYHCSPFLLTEERLGVLGLNDGLIQLWNVQTGALLQVMVRGAAGTEML